MDTVLMERAARVVKNTKFSKKILTDDDLARAVWPAAAGKAIAAHTYRVRLVRNSLVVEVEDAIWQKQLFNLSRQILDRVHFVIGSTAITDIEFRVAVKRREPQRAETPRPSLLDGLQPPDEADAIQDHVLKKLYLLSRKKATA